MLNRYSIEVVQIVCDRCRGTSPRAESVEAATAAATDWYVSDNLFALCPACFTLVKTNE